MDIQLRVTAEGLDAVSLDEWTGYEEMRFKAIRQVLARFVVDAAGAPVEVKTAYAHLGRLTTAEVKELVKLFRRRIQEAAGLDPTSGGE